MKATPERLRFRETSQRPDSLPVCCLRDFANPIHHPPLDPQVAYICACFSELAYLHLTDRELDDAGRYKSAPSLCFRELTNAGVSFDLRSMEDFDIPSFVFSTDAFVYAGFVVRKTAVVAIRGTHTLWDILVDLMSWRERTTRGYALHYGFAREARRAIPLLVKHLSRFRNIDGVLFTGHSLGGALAGVLDFNWPRGNDHIRSLSPYTFGAPRYAAVRPGSDLTHVLPYRRPLDLIPHLPPRWMGYSDPPFVSPVTDALSSARRSPTTQRPYHELPDFWAVARAWTPRPGGPALARHHAIELYRHQLGLAVGKDYPHLAYWEFARAAMRSKPV